MNEFRPLVILLSLFGWSFGATGLAESVSYFRSDNGVIDEHAHTLPERLDSSELAWRCELASGQSTPCVARQLLIVTTYQGTALATVAIDKQTGVVRWTRTVPTNNIESFHPTGSPATATAACDDERVYTFFGSYGLLCYDLEGTLLWSKRLGPFQDEFGAASSPILVDGKIILNEDHDLDSFLIAADKKTGETLWTVPRDGFTRSYSTPVVWKTDETKQIVVAGSLQLVGYDPAAGNKLWWVNGLARIVNTTPVKGDDMLYVATWSPGGDNGTRVSMQYWPRASEQWDKNNDGKLSRSELPDGPALLRFFRIDLNQDGGLDEFEWTKHARVFELARNSIIAIRPNSTGDLTDTGIVWKHERGVPYVPSPLVYRGSVFMVKNGGIVTTLNANTGDLIKRGRTSGSGPYYASPIAGDGKVYLASERGVVTILKAEANWRILSSYDFDERIMATPVIDEGKLYVRTNEALYCFGTPSHVID